MSFVISVPFCGYSPFRLVKYVFFPADVADCAGPPTLSPMTEIRHRMFGAAPQAFRLRRNLSIFDFSFGHFKYS